jgi:hypothetical protein
MKSTNSVVAIASTVVVVGAAIVGASGGGAAASVGSPCGERGWPTTAEGSPGSLSGLPDGYYLWHSSTGWHIRIKGGEAARSGRVVASAPMRVTGTSSRTTRRLRRGARSFSFDGVRAVGTERIDFRALCTTRLAFRFGPARPNGSVGPPEESVFLGARARAVGSRFVLSRPGRTGVIGRIVIAPNCPVEGVQECGGTAKPARGTVRIETDSGVKGQNGSFVTAVKSDAGGTFSAPLGPGDYVLTVVETDATGVTPRPVQVTVEQGVVSDVTLVLDTGIR